MKLLYDYHREVPTVDKNGTHTSPRQTVVYERKTHNFNTGKDPVCYWIEKNHVKQLDLRSII